MVVVEGKLREHLPCVHLQATIDGGVCGQRGVDAKGRHGEGVVGQGVEARIEVKAAVVVFHAQSQRGRDACPEAHRALVVERSPRGGCLHGGGEVEALVRKGQRHRRIAGQNGGKLAIEEGHAVGQEGDGTGGVFALQTEVGTAHPLPAGAVAALQGNLLREGVHALPLFQGENVGTEEVLVHKEAVAQVLYSRDAGQREGTSVPGEAQGGIEQAAAVAALAVLSNFIQTNEGATRGRCCCRANEEVGAGLLIAVFVGRG